MPPRPMRSDATRNHEAILTAAIEVLARTPDASMQDVAEASGTGRTTLYRHFPDRLALLEAARERVVAEAAEITDRALADPGDPVMVVADLSVELAGLGDRYGFLEQHPDAEPRSDPGRSGAVIAYLEAAQAGGRVRADLDADWLLQVLVALITMVAKGWGGDAADGRRQLHTTVVALLTPPH